VKVVGAERIPAFARKHPDSLPGLDHWNQIVNAAAWKTPAEVKATFRSADFVGGRTVFHIGGGKYRLIAAIMFRLGIVAVTAVLKQSEYDKGNWK
jgi:mRNA interferase HigB